MARAAGKAEGIQHLRLCFSARARAAAPNAHKRSQLLCGGGFGRSVAMGAEATTRRANNMPCLVPPCDTQQLCNMQSPGRANETKGEHREWGFAQTPRDHVATHTPLEGRKQPMQTASATHRTVAIARAPASLMSSHKFFEPRRHKRA